MVRGWVAGQAVGDCAQLHREKKTLKGVHVTVEVVWALQNARAPERAPPGLLGPWAHEGFWPFMVPGR